MTCGPVVVSTRLKNVTESGIWGWDNRWTLSYHPSTWYFDDATASSVGDALAASRRVQRARGRPYDDPDNNTHVDRASR